MVIRWWLYICIIKINWNIMVELVQNLFEKNRYKFEKFFPRAIGSNLIYGLMWIYFQGVMNSQSFWNLNWTIWKLWISKFPHFGHINGDMVGNYNTYYEEEGGAYSLDQIVISLVSPCEFMIICEPKLAQNALIIFLFSFLAIIIIWQNWRHVK
jgi:hypothetical protein